MTVTPLVSTVRDVDLAQYELQQFAARVHRRLPEYTLGATHSRRAVLYKPGHTFCSLFLSYEDLRKNKYDKPTFNVFSHVIDNPRYAVGSYNRRSRSSKVMEKAVDIAVNNVYRELPEDVSAFYLPKLYRGIQDSRRGHDTSVDDAARRAGLIKGGIAERELIALRRAGAELLDRELAQHIDSLISAMSEAEHDRIGDGRPVLFVYLRDGVAFTRDHRVAQSKYSTAVVPRSATGSQQVQLSDLPEAVVTNMAVLQMCDVAQYVPNVGLRASDTVYYVFV